MLQPLGTAGIRRMNRYVHWAAVGVILMLGLLTLLQRKIMYPATTATKLPAAAYPLLTQLFHSAVDIELTTPDRLKIRGWHLRRNPKPSQFTWLLFHGNGGDRARRGRWYQMASQLNCDVIAIDYHGYGDSEGRPSQDNLCEDARAAWSYARNELGLPSERIIVVGESLGGAVAVQLAAEASRKGEIPKALVLACTFDSMLNAANHHFPIIPVNWILADRWESDRQITDVACHILQFHGDSDVVVPLPLGQRLHNLAPPISHDGRAKQFFLFPGTNHNDLLSRDGEEIQRQIGMLVNGEW